MTDKNFDGGPAFPLQHTICDANSEFFKQGQKGMSLRDWFAGMALQGILTKPSPAGMKKSPNFVQVICKNSYFVADAMLKAREE